MKKLAILVFVLCGSHSVLADSDVDAAANDVCKCLEEPYKLANATLEKINKAKASGDFSQIMTAQGDMMAVIDATSACVEALPAKYPEIDKSEALQNKVMARVEALCPNPASKFMQN